MRRGRRARPGPRRRGPRLAAVAVAGLAAWLAALGVPAGGAEPPELTVSDEVSTTGHYQVAWTEEEAGADGAAATPYVLEEAPTAAFADGRVIYRGSQSALSLSGRRDGVYFYRVRTGEGPWSEPVQVEVEHHDLGRALLFLGLGAVVFLATAGLIVGGHLAQRRQDGAAPGGGGDDDPDGSGTAT